MFCFISLILFEIENFIKDISFENSCFLSISKYLKDCEKNFLRDSKILSSTHTHTPKPCVCGRKNF